MALPACHRVQSHVVRRMLLEEAKLVEVRLAMLARIDDERALAEIVKTNTHWQVRKEALTRVQHARLIEDIVFGADSPHASKLATQRVADPALLARIARQCRHGGARIAAVQQLSDRSALAAELALSDGEA